MTESSDRHFGALLVEDPRDRNYPMAAMHELVGVAKLPAMPRKVDWRLGPRLYQGATPHCCGFTGEELLQADPVRQTYLDGHRLYQRAHAIDGIPGPHEGTTQRAVLQVLRAAGRVGAYFWTQSWDDVIRQLSFVGPCMMAAPWLGSMDQPNEYGHLQVDPKSGVRGGHSMLLYGHEDDWWHLTTHWESFGADPPGSVWLYRGEYEKFAAAGLYTEIVAVTERRA